jgi:hypothetical protein
MKAFNIAILILSTATFSFAHADDLNSQDLVKLISSSGKVVFLKNESIPASSMGSIYSPDAMSAMTDVVYQGALRFVNRGDVSIDTSKLTCDIQYSNSRQDIARQQPLAKGEVRSGVLITGMDISFQAGQAVQWDAPTSISEATSYSTPMGDSILRGIHLNFYSSGSALIDIDCSQTVSISAPAMHLQEFEEATGGLLTLRP